MKDNKFHVGCGGRLVFDEAEGKKVWFTCEKCRASVNVIDCPSWEQYVLSGRIRIEKEQYWLLKKRDMERRQRWAKRDANLAL